MSKKTIIVRHHHEFINNFDILPKSIMVGDTRILRVNDPSPLEATVEQDFDLLITADHHVSKVIRDNYPVVQLPRYDKFDQHEMIKNAMLKNVETFYDFRHIKTYRLSDPRLIVEITRGKIVFKHPDGARGLGQIVADLEKIGLFQAVTHVKEIIKIAATTVELKASGKPINLEETAKVIEDRVAGIEGLVLSHGSTKFDLEWVDSLSGIGVVQEVIEGVESEWRIIVDMQHRPVWIQKRKISGDEFPTATGSDGYPNRGDDTLEFNKHYPGVLKRMVETFKVLDIRMNSVDLFICGTQWGFFEFCNQWGISGVNPNVARTLQLDALVGVLVDHQLIKI